MTTRIAVMQNNPMITNDVLGAKLDAIGQRVEKVELKVDNLGSAYVPHDIFELRLKELETQIVSMNLAIIKLDRKKGAQMWILGTTSAVAAVILSFLIQFYISNVGKK